MAFPQNITVVLRCHSLAKKFHTVTLCSTSGSRPGVTTRVQNRVRILDNPKIYIVDTPGVLNPNARSIEEAMKLALCNLILESATQVTYVADYLLFWMNK